MSLIQNIHYIISLFIVFGFLFNNSNMLKIHLIFNIIVILHWLTNNNKCLKMIKNQTITNKNNIDDITKNGFKYGINDITKLGLTNFYKNDDKLKLNGGYNFAYQLDEFIRYSKDKNKEKYKYLNNNY